MGNCIRHRFQKCNGRLFGPPQIPPAKGARAAVAANAFQLAFLPNAFDFVLCSSVLHHFGDHEVIKLIEQLRRVARGALIVLDLQVTGLRTIFFR